VAQIERRMREWTKEDKAVKAISEIPGVGLLTATAAVAIMGDARAFRSGREFAAWAGLVPKQTGSGGEGESAWYVEAWRHVSAHVADSRCASGVGACKGARTGVEQIQKRRPKNVVIVALANKMARTIWAVLCHDRSYQKDYVSMRPA